jgi:hypothetical protein
MIVGVGIETKWGATLPCFGHLGDGHYFYWEGEQGEIEIIEKLDFDKFIWWLSDDDLKNDSSSFDDIQNKMSKYEFSSLINKYYERGPFN